MFAYCDNTPVATIDSAGNIPTQVSKCVFSSDYTPLYGAVNIIEKWKVRGVEYIPNSSGGGQIKNSYLITDGREMVLYAEYLRSYTDDFLGSVQGMVFEWEVHNLLYYYFDAFDQQSPWYVKARDVDLGRTIYDDNHGTESKLMWMLYAQLYPVQAQEDQQIYWDYMGG